MTTFRNARGLVRMALAAAGAALALGALGGCCWYPGYGYYGHGHYGHAHGHGHYHGCR